MKKIPVKTALIFESLGLVDAVNTDKLVCDAKFIKAEHSIPITDSDISAGDFVSRANQLSALRELKPSGILLVDADALKKAVNAITTNHIALTLFPDVAVTRDILKLCDHGCLKEVRTTFFGRDIIKVSGVLDISNKKISKHGAYVIGCVRLLGTAVEKVKQTLRSAATAKQLFKQKGHSDVS